MLRNSIKSLMWKQYKYHINYWRVKLINIGLPIFAGIVVVYIKHREQKKHSGTCKHVSASEYFDLVEFLQSITTLNLVLLPIVQEKSSGMKEFLGISCRHSNWNLVTFFVLQVAINIAIFAVVLLWAWFLSISEHFEMKYLTLLVVLYNVANIAFMFALSVMFNKVFHAAMISIMIIIIGHFWPNTSSGLHALYYPTLLHDGFDLMDGFGDSCNKFTSDNLLLRYKHSGKSLLEIYIWLVIDSFLYFGIYNYFVGIFPGEFGHAKSATYPLENAWNLWKRCATRKQRSVEPILSETINESHTDSTNEFVRRPVVQVTRLVKEFHDLWSKQRVRAVDEINFHVFANQITVLLGHNGAGKTTTISMICGYLQPTSGTIFVDGETQSADYRHKIGYCPQQDIILPFLTCKEHLYFFGVIRGLSKEEADSSAKVLLETLGLLPKADQYGSKLSGGMKRRLCLGNAIIGNTSVAILDEPTSGLDPVSRRQIWHILMKLRQDHTILVTTHEMEDAEALADRVLIMAEGKILSEGTIHEIKFEHGSGYQLKLMCTPRMSVGRLMTQINHIVPNARLRNEIEMTVNITLPYADVSSYPDLLSRLENQMYDLGILSISIANTTMEDVFLRSAPARAYHRTPLKKDELNENEARLSFLFYMLFYLMLPYEEAHCEFKTLQPVSPILFWGNTFLIDAILQLLFLVLVICAHILFNKLKLFDQAERTFLFFVLYAHGLSFLPHFYAITLIVKSRVFMLAYLIANNILHHVIANLYNTSQHVHTHWDWLLYYLMLLPDFNIARTLHIMCLRHSLSIEENSFSDYTFGTIKEPGLLISLAYYTGFFVVESVLLVFVGESLYRKDSIIRFFRRLLFWKKRKTQIHLQPQSGEVKEKWFTETVVQSQSMDQYPIVMHGLGKLYGKMQAVSNVNLTIRRGECFGVLGLDGSGKTTLLKMLACVEPVSQGTYYFQGRDSVNHIKSIKKRIGTCPQVNALLDFMTAFELVKYMAMLQGYSYRNVDKRVDEILRSADLQKYSDVLIKNFSVGTKRKLSVALALQSKADVVLMDEPTTAIDPASRRIIWQSIQACQQRGSSIVLSSHSVDEAETLFNRVAIQVNGEIFALGHARELKTVFILDFIINVQLRENVSAKNVKRLKEFIRATFTRAELREEFGTRLYYVVHEANPVWSIIFRRLLHIQTAHSKTVTSVSVSESSLVDVFLQIAMKLKSL